MMYRLDLSAIPPLAPQRGDYDGDLDVDGTDLLAWQRTLGADAPPFSGADWDGNGVIDAGDLAVWKLRFGAGSTPPGTWLAQVSVPEPATALMLAAAAMGIVCRRRTLSVCNR